MEWITLNSIHDAFSSLYTQNGKTFTVNDDCLAILEHILKKLSSDDSTLHTFRRALGLEQIVKNHLIPILLHVKNGRETTDATKIIDTTIRILVSLTLPVEYLLSTESTSSTEGGRHTVFDLNKLLLMSTEAFTDSKITKAVVDYMKDILENNNHLNFEQCDSINNCLLLFRNVLHTPETKTVIPNSSQCQLSMQNRIIWNLFMHGVDKIIIYLLACSQKKFWSVTIVQVIALMYKDQHVGTLQKLLNVWLEASLSDSSEDDESNTSPFDIESDDLSSLITSNSTSDLSDNGDNDMNKHNIIQSVEAIRTVENPNNVVEYMKTNSCIETETGISSELSSGNSTYVNKNQIQMLGRSSSSKIESYLCPFSQSEISDCGYVTQIETHESLSTSDEDHKYIYKKPHIFQKGFNKNCRVTAVLEKKDLRRKKFVKRSSTNRIKMRGQVHHAPTDEDISNILKEFTVDFLLKGYGTLVNDLHIQILTNIHFHIDASHFFWLITYFLKFATQMELDPEYLGPILSYEILSFLIFQAVCTHEELEISYTVPGIDLKPYLRRLHLIVKAIKEFFQTLQAYQKMIHLNDDDLHKLSALQIQIREMEDFRMLFVLLLRQFKENIQSKQYLQDLILTNHNFLLYLEDGTNVEDQHYNIMIHLNRFATVKTMRQYGLLLENFKENGEFVNNCIFTMMHHICSHIENVPKLFQPSILKSFLQIWETDYEICDDWSDLIEYVIHKFINTPETYCIDTTSTPLINFQNYFQEIDQHESSEDYKKYEYKKKKDIFQKYYKKCSESLSTINKVTGEGEIGKIKQRTEHYVMEQNISNVNDSNDMTEKNNTHIDRDEQPHKENVKEKFEEKLNDSVESDIKILIAYLHNENKSNSLIWLQKILIEVGYTKRVLNNPKEFRNNNNTLEPVVFHYVSLNLPIPLIPWTVDDTDILDYQPFVLLLHKLGFHLPKDTGKSFVRIPNFWSADYIFSIAQKLGPIKFAKFDVHNLSRRKIYNQAEIKPNFTGNNEQGVNLKQSPSSIYSDTSIEPSSNADITSDIPSVQRTVMEIIRSERENSTTNMECSPIYEPFDVLERNSDCDTSLSSELLNMYVSDEEDKVIFVIEKN